MSKKITTYERVRVEKLVHGGQGLVTLPDGKKAFVWNALPDELVDVEISRNRKDYAEGFVTQVISQNPSRIDFLERTDIRLSVSPWAIMDFDTEMQQKSDILSETFARESVKLSDAIPMKTSGQITAYRNKVEFSFWGDDEGLFFAHYVRASHQKIKLTYPYNPLVRIEIADKAQKILSELQTLGIRASDIKSLIVRCTEARGAKGPKVVAALFVKTREFVKMSANNLAVVYSNPKSPASVVTEVIYTNGDITCTDSLLNKDITYDVFSFFQVNLPAFTEALCAIAAHTKNQHTIDMYSGVGSIGLTVGSSLLVESDKNNIPMAIKNASGSQTEVVHATSENALEYITSDSVLIVDPPRSGLHADVTKKIVAVKPPKVVYLSCNPSTQARDVKILLDAGYALESIDGYNFFPRTPHIESLVVLKLR